MELNITNQFTTDGNSKIIGELLQTGSVEFDGETIKIERFDLWFKPRRPEIPIYLAGLFPKWFLRAVK